MAEEILQVEHYSASIPHKVGEGLRVLGALRDAGVNLIAFWGYPYGIGRAKLEFVSENDARFVAAADVAEFEMQLDGKKIAEYRVTARIYFDIER